MAIAPGLPESVCDNPEDNKFVACVLAGKVKYIISGDRHLLKASGYHGVKVIRPGEFVDSYPGEDRGRLMSKKLCIYKVYNKNEKDQNRSDTRR